MPSAESGEVLHGAGMTGASVMGEFTDKLKGTANEAVGKAKRAIGDALDRPDIHAEGDMQEAAGDLQKASGSVKGAFGDKI